MLTFLVFLACVLVSGCEGAVIEDLRLAGDGWPREGRAVSYTHLTLPTSSYV